MLRKHLPEVTAEEFASFIGEADTDKDGKLSRQEMLAALADEHTTVFLGAIMSIVDASFRV